MASVAISPGAKYLAYGDAGRIWLWNLATGRQVISLTDGLAQVGELTFSPNGTLLASGADDGTVRLWNVATGQLMATLATNADNVAVSALTFSNDGSLLAASKADGTVQQWETGLFANPAATLCAEVPPTTDSLWSQYATGEPKPHGCR